MAYRQAPSPYPFHTLNTKLSGKRHSVSFHTKMHVSELRVSVFITNISVLSSASKNAQNGEVK